MIWLVNFGGELWFFYSWISCLVEVRKWVGLCSDMLCLLFDVFMVVCYLLFGVLIIFWLGMNMLLRKILLKLVLLFSWVIGCMVIFLVFRLNMKYVSLWCCLIVGLEWNSLKFMLVNGVCEF